MVSSLFCERLCLHSQIIVNLYVYFICFLYYFLRRFLSLYYCSLFINLNRLFCFVMEYLFVYISMYHLMLSLLKSFLLSYCFMRRFVGIFAG